MLQSKGYWLSAFNDNGDIHVRYHPVVGCGEYYTGGIDTDIVLDLSKQVFTKLQAILDTEMSSVQVHECQYDGAVAESNIGNCNWADVVQAVKQLDLDLSDLCLEYVELDMENEDD